MPGIENIENGSENIKVFVRILPLLKRCDSCMKISPDRKTIFVKYQRSSKQEKNPLYLSFRTSGIFYDCSQNEIYNETIHDTITKVLDGANCAVISCGQTGTGKSFTLGGLRNNWEHRGFVPRLLTDMLAARVRKKPTNKIHYSLSYVEFRGRKLRDLLNPRYQNCIGNKGETFKNITRVSIKSERDALRHIFQGEGRRALAEGSTYPACHLGTAVITFHVHNTSLITSWSVVTEGAIHVVEMAGIDTPGKADCPKKSRDVVAANSTKLEIEQFFANLAGSERIASPIARSSGLIRYLGDALSRDSLIRFIAHVRVTNDDLNVALSTLRLAARIGQIQPLKISYKVKPQDTMTAEKLNEKIVRLRWEFNTNEMFFEQETYMNGSKSRAKQIERDFLGYLNGSASDVKLLNFSQMQVLAKMMKDFYAKSETRRKNSTSKERVTSVEVAEEIRPIRVGTLDVNDVGITVGPGIAKTPPKSAMRILNVAKMSRNESRRNCGEPQTEKETKDEKEWQENMRKTFQVMQKILTRPIEVGPETSRKPWNASTAFAREK